MAEKLARILAKSPLFEGVAEEELPGMLQCLKPRRAAYQKGEFIATAGEILTGVGIIVSGKAAVIKEQAAGGRVVLTLLKPGDLFGETAAFSKTPRWPAAVQAREAAAVIFLPRENIVGQCAKNCRHHRLLIDNMLQIISERNLMLNQKLNYLTIKSMRGRISAFLLDRYRKAGRASFTLPMNRAEMADFLYVSRPSMSRELGRMKKDGIIDYHLATFQILNPAALKKTAE